MLRRLLPLFLIFSISITGITAFSIWKSTLPLISPIALIETMIGNSPAVKSKKIIYGFFPYWNTKHAEQLNIEYLTHLAYFAIDLNPDGTIYKKNSSKELEPGWNKLNSKSTEKLLYQSKLLGQKTVVTVTAMDPDLIESIVTSDKHIQTAISSIMSVYRDFDFDDINIDFEYVGEPNKATRDGFSAFIKRLKASCMAENSKCAIDIDVFGDSGAKYRLWDLEALSESVDRVIVMAYDYYRKSSSQAGPVAPLIGKCVNNFTSDNNCLDMDIITHISLIAKMVPSEKIILGVPFYGYDWQTASADFLANTYPRTGTLATYQRVKSLLSDPKGATISARWSETTLSPYLIIEKDNTIRQIHYENSESLSQKIKLVETANLGGVAIWALGYETPHQDIWKPFDRLISL